VTAPGGWRRSSYCAAGDCIEVKATVPGYPEIGLVHLRRVVAPDGLVWDSMVVSRPEFDAFLAAAKAGESGDLVTP